MALGRGPQTLRAWTRPPQTPRCLALRRGAPQTLRAWALGGQTKGHSGWGPLPRPPSVAPWGCSPPVPTSTSRLSLSMNSRCCSSSTNTFSFLLRKSTSFSVGSSLPWGGTGGAAPPQTPELEGHPGAVGPPQEAAVPVGVTGLDPPLLRGVSAAGGGGQVMSWHYQGGGNMRPGDPPPNLGGSQHPPAVPSPCHWPLGPRGSPGEEGTEVTGGVFGGGRPRNGSRGGSGDTPIPSGRTSCARAGGG